MCLKFTTLSCRHVVCCDPIASFRILKSIHPQGRRTTSLNSEQWAQKCLTISYGAFRPPHTVLSPLLSWQEQLNLPQHGSGVDAQSNRNAIWKTLHKLNMTDELLDTSFAAAGNKLRMATQPRFGYQEWKRSRAWYVWWMEIERWRIQAPTSIVLFSALDPHG